MREEIERKREGGNERVMEHTSVRLYALCTQSAERKCVCVCE